MYKNAARFSQRLTRSDFGLNLRLERATSWEKLGGSKKPEAEPKPKKAPDAPMTAEEGLHFTKQAALLEKYAPIVRDLAREGVRKPKEVSAALNRMGHRTSAKAKWTPRLTWLLLGLLFSGGEEKAVAHEAAEPEDAPAKARKIKIPAKVKPREVVPLTPEEMANRLQALKRHFSGE